MKPKLTIDAKKVLRAIGRGGFNASELTEIARGGSSVIKQKQVEGVPVRSGATRDTIEEVVVNASSTRVTIDTAPKTPYYVYLEMGTGIYAESGKGRKGGWWYFGDDGRFHFTMGMRPRPFIRPSIFGNESNIVAGVTREFKEMVRRKWQV